MIEKNPTLYQTVVDNNVDYSEMYRTQETRQLNKRLRKTRNTLLISATAMVTGAVVFLLMPETSFSISNSLTYVAIAGLMCLLSLYSNKQPFFTIVAGIVICIALWGYEIFFNDVNELLVASSIHKLFIISFLAWCYHCSREAELIRKELYFS